MTGGANYKLREGEASYQNYGTHKHLGLGPGRCLSTLTWPHLHKLVYTIVVTAYTREQ